MPPPYWARPPLNCIVTSTIKTNLLVGGPAGAWGIPPRSRCQTTFRPKILYYLRRLYAMLSGSRKSPPGGFGCHIRGLVKFGPPNAPSCADPPNDSLKCATARGQRGAKQSYAAQHFDTERPIEREPTPARRHRPNRFPGKYSRNTSLKCRDSASSKPHLVACGLVGGGGV